MSDEGERPLPHRRQADFINIAELRKP